MCVGYVKSNPNTIKDNLCEKGSCNKSPFFIHTIAEDVLDSDFESRLIIGKASHYPFPSWPAFESNEWLLRAPLCSPCPLGKDPYSQAPTQTRTTTGRGPILWGLSPKAFLSEKTCQPWGLCGPHSTGTVQPSRCCLSGPTASPACWEWCHSACPPSLSTHIFRLL